MIFDTTICAPATSSGGALSVIRISGKDCFRIMDKIFVAASGNKVQQQPASSVRFGKIYDKNELIDEVLVTVFKTPYSYTGEDTVEISCHGSEYIKQRIMNLLIKNGAMLASPGEFTQRAFLNGKMDLAQAEAVADLIASETSATHKIALQQMRGGFSLDLENLRGQLLHFVSLIELELDFSEEDVEFADRTKLQNLITDIEKRITELLNSFELGNVLKNGVPVAIAGEPNVGKSTLLNTLLNEDKALVSDIAGTTRDAVEDLIDIDGIQFRFIDTAGIRATTDKIEQMGIERTMEKIDKAQIVLLLVDASQDDVPKKITEFEHKIKDKKFIVLLNKTDLVFENKYDIPENIISLEISAKYKKNIDKLRKLLKDIINYDKEKLNDTIITNSRHFQELTHAKQACKLVLQGIESGQTIDLLTQDIKLIVKHIGNITGKISSDEVLRNIFKNFCIGK